MFIFTPQVGLLVVGHNCPKINLQFANETGYLEILKMVQEKLPDMGTSQNNKASEDNQRNVAFQVSITYSTAIVIKLLV